MNNIVLFFTEKSASCSSSPEALASVQPLIEQNILLESCPIASIERSLVTLISKSGKVLYYNAVERISADKSPNCSASSEECEIFLVSNLINNSTSQVSVEAKCDGENVIGFTIGYLCLGTSKFPCTSGKPWKMVARPAGLVEVEILCPSTPGFQNISGGNTATLDAPNETNEYSFNVKPLPNGSTFDLLVEFTVELFYNDDLKVTIDVAVVEENANVYRAFAVVPSRGLYEVLNEYEFE
ncbi:uncharacterized protein [Oscarella lobularis]|uniref:uncharacterized protein n=1 Tax=Oscarella lobularis TaxID=121494 RepID=UPI003313AA0E